MDSIVKAILDTSEIDRYKYLAVVQLFTIFFLLSNTNFSGSGDADSSGTTLFICIFLAIVIFLTAWTVQTFTANELKVMKDIADQPGVLFDFKEYFFCRVDYLFSKSPILKTYALLLATCTLILFGTILVWLATFDHPIECIWKTWSYIADAGSHADSSTGLLRIVSLALTLCGMIIFALFISLVSDEVGNYVDNLRKGKSRVVASSHTLILGHGDKLIPTIKQICLANESEGGGLIVILSSVSKEDLEQDIADAALDTKGTSVIVRTGFSHIQSDLRKVSVAAARSIIVLSDREMDTDSADIAVARTVLNIRSVLKEDSEKCSSKTDLHITCDICDIDNEELVRLVGDGIVETLVSHDIIGRLMLQCSLRPGLAIVLDSLLGFEGDEFYLESWPELVGLTFSEIMFRFDYAVVIGIMRGVDGRVVLNPPGNLILGKEDKVIVIAEDNDTYKPIPFQGLPDKEHISSITVPLQGDKRKPQKVLLVGWRRDMADLIQQVDEYVPKGSKLSLISQVSVEDRLTDLLARDLREESLQNIQITHLGGNPILRKDLETIPLASFDSILILADANLESSGQAIDMIHADSKSLTSLILIRDIQRMQKEMAGIRYSLSSSRDGSGSSEDSQTLLASASQLSSSRAPSPFLTPVGRTSSRKQREVCTVELDDLPAHSCLVSEVLDSRTKTIASVASFDDYVASNELISMLLAMISEQREVNAIFRELFSAKGNEIFLYAGSIYVNEGESATFLELQYIAYQRKHLLIGYLDENGKVILNPKVKTEMKNWSTVQLVSLKPIAPTAEVNGE